ncbi:MAG: hypothetical protein ACTSVI_09690 [Promethearchaeota archaeon]
MKKIESSLKKEALPLSHLSGILLLLISLLISIYTFSANSGRHVPTGSILGFQGPSYFYCTGLISLITLIFWIPTLISRFKVIKISSNVEKLEIEVHEKSIFRRQDEKFTTENLKTVFFKKYPRRAIFWILTIMAPLFFFNIQMIHVNFSLPFIRTLPVTGLTLLAFDAIFGGVIFLFIRYPGITIIFLTIEKKIKIKLPGVIRTRKITEIFKNHLKQLSMIPLIAIRDARDDNDKNAISNWKINDSRNKSPGKYLEKYSRIAMEIALLSYGIFAIFFLLEQSTIIVINFQVAVLFILVGIFGIIDHVKEKSRLQENTLVKIGLNVKKLKDAKVYTSWLRFSLIILATWLLFYLTSKSLEFWAMNPILFQPRWILLLIIAALFITGAIFILPNKEKPFMVDFSDGKAIIITSHDHAIIFKEKIGKNLVKNVFFNFKKISWFVLSTCLLSFISSFLLS